MRNYGSIDYILRMPVNDAMSLVDTAAENDRREFYYRQYLVYLARMDKETFISFADYYESTKPKQVDTRPKDEIMRDILRKGG